MLHRSNETLSEIFGIDRVAKDLFTSTIANVSPRHATYRSLEVFTPELPFVIQPMNHEVEDFFVSVSAYYQAYSPITAFVHVLDEECSIYFENFKTGYSKENAISPKKMHGALGAAVGETVLASLGSTTGGSEPSYASCKRSASFALARAKAIYPFCRDEYVTGKWVAHRKMTGLATSVEVVNAVNEAFSLLFDSGSNASEPLPDALRAYAGGTSSDRVAMQMLMDLYPGIGEYLYDLRGPFDGRMRAFNQLVELVQKTSHGSSFDSLAIGFFANRIQPGSFAHVKTLTKLIDVFPTALVWYGVFCGLSEEFSASDFAYGLIAKLERDARQPFSFDQRPSCDFSLEELQVLMRLPIKAEALKPSQQKIALVSLLPGVEIYSRLSVDDEPAQHYNDQNPGVSASDESDAHLTVLLEDALSLIRRRKPVSKRNLESPQKRQSKNRL